MPDALLAHFLGTDEATAKALTSAGLRLAEDPERGETDSAEAIRLGTQRVGTQNRLPPLVIASHGIEVWAAVHTLAAGSVLSLEMSPNEVLPYAEAVEGLLCRLFDSLKVPYGYVSWKSTTPAYGRTELFSGKPERAFDVELEAIGRGRPLQLYALNFFSEELQRGLPGLRGLLDSLRVVSLASGSTLVALTKSLLWEPLKPEDMMSLEAGLDLCWQATGRLDAHVSGCSR